LIEMLVVIAIIAILAAMLAPSLNKAINSGRSIVCMNNLKQIGLVVSNYSNEYSGYVPGGYYWFLGNLSNYYYNKPPDSISSSTEFIKTRDSIWVCPENIQKLLNVNGDAYWGSRIRKYSTYSLNQYISSLIPTGYTPFRVTKIAKPGSIFYLSETSTQTSLLVVAGLEYCDTFTGYTLGQPHSNETKANLLYLTGHVEAISMPAKNNWADIVPPWNY